MFKNIFRRIPEDYVPHPEDLNNIEVILEKWGFNDDEFEYRAFRINAKICVIQVK